MSSVECRVGADIRFRCVGCGNCCRSHGAYSYVYLTLPDRRRLARHLGLATLQFTKRYCAKTNGHFHLKEPEKDCMFLEKGRCSVYAARPAQCRTWPFWTENMNRDTWLGEIVPSCPGIGRGRVVASEKIAALLEEQKDVPRP